MRDKLVDFADARITRVTFRVPAMHCIACVWLLENLFQLKAGIGQSQVNFPRQEVAITFENANVRLSEVVALLASLGYEPDLKLSDLSRRPANPFSLSNSKTARHPDQAQGQGRRPAISKRAGRAGQAGRFR